MLYCPIDRGCTIGWETSSAALSIKHRHGGSFQISNQQRPTCHILLLTDLDGGRIIVDGYTGTRSRTTTVEGVYNKQFKNWLENCCFIIDGASV